MAAKPEPKANFAASGIHRHNYVVNRLARACTEESVKAVAATSGEFTFAYGPLAAVDRYTL